MQQTLLSSSACVLFSLAIASSASGQFVIGGFTPARGGAAAIAGGNGLDELRASIVAAFPGTTFAGAGTLTPEFLGTVDVLWISSATAAAAAIVPLSSAEQAALLAFVENGGTAVLCVDNDTFAGAASDPANESIIDPFGMDIVGTGLPWAQVATIIDPAASTVSSGPFGTVTSWLVGWAGWFNTVPDEAVVLANIAQSGLPGLVVFPRHSLAACSGVVVVYSDVTAFADDFFAPGTANDILMLNTISLLAEPTCVTGLCGDIDGSGEVDGGDLGVLLGAWNTDDRAADLNADGVVDGGDLGILLGNWGRCSER